MKIDSQSKVTSRCKNTQFQSRYRPFTVPCDWDWMLVAMASECCSSPIANLAVRWNSSSPHRSFHLLSLPHHKFMLRELHGFTALSQFGVFGMQGVRTAATALAWCLVYWNGRPMWLACAPVVVARHDHMVLWLYISYIYVAVVVREESWTEEDIRTKNTTQSVDNIWNVINKWSWVHRAV